MRPVRGVVVPKDGTVVGNVVFEQEKVTPPPGRTFGPLLELAGVRTSEAELVRQFGVLFYERVLMLSYFGVPLWKNPLDLWIYMEIIFETRPDVLVECGTGYGGSALWFAHAMDRAGAGRVITIDARELRPQGAEFNAYPVHERVLYLRGDSVEMAPEVRRRVSPASRTMVVLDSSHRKSHVLAEMRAYGKMVAPGCYMVVEDTNICGNPVPIYTMERDGPAEAVGEFLKTHREFEVDRRREKFLVTYNPGGWLRKTR